MGTVVRALWWKEWREAWPAVPLGVFIVAGWTVLSLRARLLPDVASVLFGVIAGAVVYPVLVATGLIAPEREAGTLALLRRLPVATAATVGVKLAVGAIVVAAPLVCGAAAFVAMAAGRELTASEGLATYAAAGLMGVAVMLWTAALGADQPSEARVGLVGIGMLVGVFAIGAVVDGVGKDEWLWTLNATPFGPLLVDESNTPSWSAVGRAALWQVVPWAAAVAWAVWRVGRIGRAER